MALKSIPEERAILRARSALQRFPVVEWRQRMEDLHRRSINTSRSLAGGNAWRESDCNGAVIRPMMDIDDWNPIVQAQPTQPDWDAHSINDQPMSPQPHSPTEQASHDNFSPGDYGNRSGRDLRQHRSASVQRDGFNNFLERANRTIGRDKKNTPDPFLNGESQPSQPFGIHSRNSSVESLSSIVSEKPNSPLNKAIAAVRSFTFLYLYIRLIRLVHRLGRRCGG